MKSRAPQLHLEYRFYKQLGQSGKITLSVLDVGRDQSDSVGAWRECGSTALFFMKVYLKNLLTFFDLKNSTNYIVVHKYH